MDALYIHIPFCEKKCYYCDFWTFINMEREIDRYAGYILKEYSLYHEYTYDSVYFGGGTPSLLGSKNLGIILDRVKKSENTEITVEINPKSIKNEDLFEYTKNGINRLSIGIQSFQGYILETLGRNHSPEEALLTYEKTRKAGFENINLDLIFGVPGQSLEDLKKDLEILRKIEPEHISIYSLIWEKGTLFWKQKEKGILSEMDEDLEAEMYELIIDTLVSYGYSHYEISNFARPGKEAVHNSKYWENREFIGLGLNASGNYQGKRYKNLKKFHEYYEALDNMKKPVEAKSIEIIDEEEKRKMEIILGLRLLEKGIEFFQDKRVEKLLSDKLLEKKKDRLVLTRKGLLLANDVFLEFI